MMLVGVFPLAIGAFLPFLWETQGGGRQYRGVVREGGSVESDAAGLC